MRALLAMPRAIAVMVSGEDEACARLLARGVETVIAITDGALRPRALYASRASAARYARRPATATSGVTVAMRIAPLIIT